MVPFSKGVSDLKNPTEMSKNEDSEGMIFVIISLSGGNLECDGYVILLQLAKRAFFIRFSWKGLLRRRQLPLL